MFVALALRYVK